MKKVYAIIIFGLLVLIALLMMKMNLPREIVLVWFAVIAIWWKDSKKDDKEK